MFKNVTLILLKEEFQEDPYVTFLQLTAFDIRGRKTLAAAFSYEDGSLRKCVVLCIFSATSY